MSFYHYLKHTIAHLFHPRRSNNWRPRILHPEALLALSLVAVIGGLAAVYFVPQISKQMGSVLGYASNITVSQVVNLTNNRRLALGLAPLKENQLLDQAATKKAQDMFAKQYWAHTAPDGTEPWYFFKQVGYQYRYAGENLAKDFATTPDMVTAWMKSPKHRENIVNPRYTQIGVAVKNGVLNGVETTLVVQLFGTPRTGLPALAGGKAVKTAQAEAKQVQKSKESIVGSSAKQIAGSQVLAKEENVLPEPDFSPLVLVKSILLSIGVMLVAVLIYDLIMIRDKHALRIVGKNVAHILFLATVMFLIFFFKSGSLG